MSQALCQAFTGIICFNAFNNPVMQVQELCPHFTEDEAEGPRGNVAIVTESIAGTS